eukprot:gnl/MRDRNA2_/MRDRNA2_89028_c0_seq1.p1 gnl/MRDRNA2_/MRDRNA2_89028_c0~~gnl/MRDRNA2_/MRDRNA2_89028_c0_seq1.p1  ORF type:complete len:760 (+),score=202.59 gnl/MRDRNA2_/MRDRNA2_89028_c0_seq1:111-2390(+)
MSQHAQIKHSALLQKCIEVIESFDPKKTTVDAHVSDSPLLKDKSLGEVERKFIHQVVYGCTRYLKLLRLFVTSFLYKHPTTARREDQTLYTILSYLLFFRLGEIGVNEFRKFYECGLGTPPALLALLQYIFNEEDLNKWVKMEWCKLYDIRYVEEDIIGKLHSFRADIQPIWDHIEMKATGALTSGGGSNGATQDTKQKNFTETVPFNLTQPKPRLIPEPETINRTIKALELPASNNATHLAKIAEEKEDRRDQHRVTTQAKYPKELEFEFHTQKRSGGEAEKQRIADQVDKERYKECSFAPAYVTPAEYREPRAPAEVKQNSASILREDALVKKKQAKEYGILKQFEEDLRDSSTYYEWQADMRERDQLERELQVQQRKIEMQQTREEAILASENLRAKNRIHAEHQKEEVRQALATQEHEQHQNLQKKQQLVHDVIEERERPRDAEHHLLQTNIKRAEDMRKDKEMDMERKKREDAYEMERKKDLIRQIRAIERVSVLKAQLFDPSEPPRKGFMEEMSLAELRERLKMLHAANEKELEDRRERNLDRKDMKQSDLLEKAENLSKVRNQARTEAQQRAERIMAKKAEEEAQRERIREQCIIEASEKIAQKKKQKREEEARLRRELKEISIKRQFLQANAEMVESKAHGEQQKGLEREARDRQNNLLLDQKKKNDIKAKEQIIRRENRNQRAEDFKTIRRDVDARLAQAKNDHTALKAEIRSGNLTARTFQKVTENKLHADVGWSSNKYSSHKGLQTAR